MPSKSKAPQQLLAAELKSGEKRLESLAEQVRVAVAASDREAFALMPLLEEAQERLSAASAKLSHVIREAQEILGSEEAAALESYPSRLANELRERGVEYSGDPNHIVIDGVVYVNFDRVKRRITINDLVAADLRVTAVASEAMAVRNRLHDEALSSQEFMADLLRAYEAEVRAAGKAAGDQVRLDALHHRMLMQRQSKAFLVNPSASAFRQYTRDQFRADLYRLLASGVSTSDGRTVAVDSGADTSGALWMMIPSLGRTGYLGRLRFAAAPDRGVADDS